LRVNLLQFTTKEHNEKDIEFVGAKLHKIKSFWSIRDAIERNQKPRD